MIKSWNNKKLKKLHDTGKPVKGIDPNVTDRLLERLDRLETAMTPGDMAVKGWNLHPLHKPLDGHFSVKVAGNWCLTFRMDNGGAYEVNYLDTHQRRTRHA